MRWGGFNTSIHTNVLGFDVVVGGKVVVVDVVPLGFPGSTWSRKMIAWLKEYKS